VSGVLLPGVVALSGCGSSMSQQTAHSGATSSRSASTALSAGPTRGSHPQRSAAGSGIVGQAVSSQCPGQAASDPGCRERPVRAKIEVLRLPDRVTAASVATDSAGRFSLSVRPGNYELVPRTSGVLLWARAVHTRVAAKERAHVVVTFLPRHPLPVSPAAVGGAKSHPTQTIA
jgi:uncharacterized protein YceK